MSKRQTREERIQPEIGSESRTHQSDAEASDINRIMGKWRTQGFQREAPGPLNPRTPVYGDFSDVQDFMAAQNAIQAAKEKFQLLPARLRRECDNDPAKLIDYVANPDNLEALREFGVLAEEPPEIVEPAAVAAAPEEPIGE